MINGDGLRSVIWVSGCTRNCKGCFSPHTHSFESGVKFDDSAKEELFKFSNEKWCDGITILGGEPLHERNRDCILELLKEFKMRFPTKTVWLYTGYQWGEVIEDSTMSEIIKYIDVICDGPYIEHLKSIDLKWVGSSNQNVINVRQRLKKVSELVQ